MSLAMIGDIPRAPAGRRVLVRPRVELPNLSAMGRNLGCDRGDEGGDEANPVDS